MIMCVNMAPEHNYIDKYW